MKAIHLAAFRDNKQLTTDVFSIEIVDGKAEIFVSKLFEFYRRCCRNDKRPEFLRFLSKFTNIPRTMKLSLFENWWALNLHGFRKQSEINNSDVVAPMYRDGGKKENKVPPYAPFKLVEGSVIEWRPPLKHRDNVWMRHLEFHVVSVDDDDDDVEEVEEAEVVADADDAVEEAEEQLIPHENTEVVVVEEEESEVVPIVDVDADAEKNKEEEIEELGVKSQVMLLQERQDRAEKSGQVVSLLDTPDKTTATIVVNAEVEILPSFEEIRSIMGFSPINNSPNDSVPHDEDLMGWHSPEAPRPNRRSIYDPIQID